MAIRLWGQLALAGALLHVWNHGLFKALLFLGAGSVLHATGTREMSRLGGLWRAMPWTAGLFALGAMAIAGLPPLNGFVSEWLVFLGLFDARAGARRRLRVAAARGGGAAGAHRRAGAGVFCESLRRGVFWACRARRRRSTRTNAAGGCACRCWCWGRLCVAIGLAPALFWPALAHGGGGLAAGLGRRRRRPRR